jgi:hypothetical protein
MTDISVNNGRVSSVLDNNDLENPTRANARFDDYALSDIIIGKQYFLRLESPEFNAYLQLINSDTGEVITETVSLLAYLILPMRIFIRTL